MRKVLFFILAGSLFLAACACNKTNSDEPEDVVKEFTATQFNGFFVDGLAGAYETFVEKDALPMSINVDGISYGRGQYLAVACLLLKSIQ